MSEHTPVGPMLKKLQAEDQKLCNATPGVVAMEALIFACELDDPSFTAVALTLADNAMDKLNQGT